MRKLKHAAMETPSENTEKDTFLSSASLNSGGINRTAAQWEGTSAKEKRKSREAEMKTAQTNTPDPRHPSVGPTRWSNAKAARRQGHRRTGGATAGRNPFLLQRRGVISDFSATGQVLPP